eukprot:gene810-880_t
MLSLSILLVLVALNHEAFGFRHTTFQRTPSRAMMTMSSTSGGIGDLLVNSSPSPVVDNALDSALDFLHEAQGEEEESEEDDEYGLYEIYEDSLDIKVPYDLIAELEEREANEAANKKPSQTVANKAVIEAAVQRWRKHEKDVGSAEVQIAVAHERIKYLTTHLLANKHDFAAKRGLNALVNERRRLLNYLYKNDMPKAREMVVALGIRYKEPGRLWDKELKYSAFKNTKNVKAEAKKHAKARARKAAAQSASV